MANNEESTSSSSKRIFNGGCHCGAVSYTLALPFPFNPDNTTATRCNCTICLKNNYSILRISNPDADFKTVASPSSSSSSSSTPSLDDVPTYRFGSKRAERKFCNQCGVHVAVKAPGLFTVNILTLDQPQ